MPIKSISSELPDAAEPRRWQALLKNLDRGETRHALTIVDHPTVVRLRRD